MRVDDADRLCVASILNPVTRLGHFNGALMGQPCRAPKSIESTVDLRPFSFANLMIVLAMIRGLLICRNVRKAQNCERCGWTVSNEPASTTSVVSRTRVAWNGMSSDRGMAHSS